MGSWWGLGGVRGPASAYPSSQRGWIQPQGLAFSAMLAPQPGAARLWPPLCQGDAAKTARDNLENYSCCYAAWLLSSPRWWPRAGVMSLRDRWLPKAPAWVPDLKYRVGREQAGW